jgi:hypothetical protein
LVSKPRLYATKKSALRGIFVSRTGADQVPSNLKLCHGQTASEETVGEGPMSVQF